MNQERVQEWVSKRAAEDDRLYERYGQRLEADHAGEFVAINREGQLISGTDELVVAKRALEQFGAGAFALRRIGAEAEIRWRHS